jgi:hypothetical protein
MSFLPSIKITFPDLTSKTATIVILLGLDLLFFHSAISGAHDTITTNRLWELFVGSNAGLLLALNAGSSHMPPPPAVPTGIL